MLNITAIACIAETCTDLSLLSERGKRTTKVKVKAAFASLRRKLKALKPNTRYILVGRQLEDEFIAESIEIATSR